MMRSPSIIARATLLIALLAAPGKANHKKTPAAPAPPPVMAEYQLKAAFLFNFGRFVTWPPHHSPSPTNALTIGVLDDSPFGSALATIEKRKIGSIPVKIRVCKTIEDMQSCHILFLNTSDTLLIKSILMKIKHRPILTVGDDPRFIRWGGILRFYMENENLRFAASPDAAARAGIQLSAQLLDLATIEQAE